jgi:hypothetical protein
VTKNEPGDGFNRDDCAQVFLHYNNANSANALVNKFDGRFHLGLPSQFKRNN